MGYYADGSGSITFLAPTGKEIDEIYSILSDVFDMWGRPKLKGTDSPPSEFTFDISASDKYYEDEVYDAFHAVEKICPIKDGCIEYCGQDGEHWRIIYREDLGWTEQAGRVVYDDLPAPAEQHLQKEGNI